MYRPEQVAALDLSTAGGGEGEAADGTGTQSEVERQPAVVTVKSPVAPLTLRAAEDLVDGTLSSSPHPHPIVTSSSPNLRPILTVISSVQVCSHHQPWQHP